MVGALSPGQGSPALGAGAVRRFSLSRSRCARATELTPMACVSTQAGRLPSRHGRRAAIERPGGSRARGPPAGHRRARARGLDRRPLRRRDGASRRRGALGGSCEGGRRSPSSGGLGAPAGCQHYLCARRADERPSDDPLAAARARRRHRGPGGRGTVTPRRHRRDGQSTIELLAALPLLVMAAVAVWQVAAAVTTTLRVEESVRAGALASPGSPVTRRRAVPALLPWARGLTAERTIAGVPR